VANGLNRILAVPLSARFACSSALAVRVVRGTQYLADRWHGTERGQRVKSGQGKSGQVKSGQVKSGRDKSGRGKKR
jgi:hypothetical protein